MSLTITLQSETASRVAREAMAAGVSVDQYTDARLNENELLWKIRTIFTEAQAHEFRELWQLHKERPLVGEAHARLEYLLDYHELAGAQRLLDIGQLAKIRNQSIQQVKDQLGLFPYPID